MAASDTVARGIEEAAITRVCEYLTRHDDTRVFTLVELSVDTAMDPATVDAVMTELAANPTRADRQLIVSETTAEFGERQWAVRQQ